MGAVYTTELIMEPKPGRSDTDIAGALERYIRHADGTRCVFDAGKAALLDGTLYPALAALFPGVTEYAGMYVADFDASYGWQGVMQEAFENAAHLLKPGSSLYIEADNDHVKGIVREDGSVRWNG